MSLKQQLAGTGLLDQGSHVKPYDSYASCMKPPDDSAASLGPRALSTSCDVGHPCRMLCNAPVWDAP